MFEWWKKIASAHRSEDETSQGMWLDFFAPRASKGFLIRLGCVALIALVIFWGLLRPCVIDGQSMMPTYDRSGFNLNKRWAYWFSEVKRGDVVIISFDGKFQLLKRVVALAGDTVEFRNGKLFVNRRQVDEPYLHYSSDWNMPERVVSPGCCYVVGDNRSQPINDHVFGEVPLERIAGQPLF